MYIFLFPTFPFHPFFLTLSEFTGFHFAWLLCQYLSHNTGSVQECRKMDTLIDNLLQRGTTCSVSKTTCFCNKTSREVYLEIGTHALMLICTFFCLLGRVALEDNLLDWWRSSLFLCLVLSRWGRDRVLVEPAWEAPALAESWFLYLLTEG